MELRSYISGNLCVVKDVEIFVNVLLLRLALAQYLKEALNIYKQI